MDLTYSPGELDLKHVQKESNSGMKRDHDSVDDFEHLDPESSPVDILSKPLIEIDSKSENITATLPKLDFSDNEGKNDQFQITKTEGVSHDETISNGKNKFPDFDLDSENPKSNSTLNLIKKSELEISTDDIPKSVETVQFDNAMISNFISAEKASNSVKTESGLVGLDTNPKDSGKTLEETPKSIKDDEDLDVPAKSMKEADAMSHYELKLDKKDVSNKDSHSESEKDLGSLVKLDFTKEQDDIENIAKSNPLIHTSTDSVAADPIRSDSRVHQIPVKDDDTLDRDQRVGKEDKHLENKSELNSSSQELESHHSETPQPDEKQANNKHEAQEEFKDFPSPDDITKHRICICPSKPVESDLDDIIGPEDVFKRIGLDAWFTPGRLHPIVEALVYWRDPKKSGVVFGGIMAILLSICYMSLISVVGHFTFFVVTGAMCFRIYKNILQAIQKTSSEGHPFKDYLEMDLSLPQDKVREMTDTAVVHINAALVELRRLVLVEDLIDSVKFALCMWCLTYVGAIFNGMTLVILAFVALFTVPKIYENNKTSIDTYIEMGRSKVAEITSKVKAAVPIGKKEPEKDKEQ